MNPNLSPKDVSLSKEVSVLWTSQQELSSAVPNGSAGLQKAGVVPPSLSWESRPRQLSSEVGPRSESLLKPFSFEFLGTRGATWDLSWFM